MSVQTINSKALVGETIRVRGQVQGVGFRPAVWRLAQDLALQGEVLNDGEGVLIRAWGTAPLLEEFIGRLRTEMPPLAHIKEIERSPLSKLPTHDGFHILESQVGFHRTDIVPDAATCSSCLEEILGPSERRFHYSFANCTHCGPRFSIIQGIPYDRSRTSMEKFPMCVSCEKEYGDPDDRRFHAQPIACADCGPRIWLESVDGDSKEFGFADDVVGRARSLLLEGKILAIKGLGGFHLACIATDPRVVQKLRERKGRYQKAFALMARDIEMVDGYCRVGELEKKLLQSPLAPIVLLQRKETEYLPEALAPGLNTMGFMLPYTPLHHLLLREMDRPVVMTSGNLAEEPQCTDNKEAKQRMREIADYFLLHDRDIVNRVDDSVVRVLAGEPYNIRRARGQAPQPLQLPAGFESVPPILALGGEMKNTFCLVQDNQAVVSQHIGDLSNASTWQDYLRNIDLYQDLYQHQPERLAIDLHPEYLSTKKGMQWSKEQRCVLDRVQHHHAHFAACLAENGVPLNTRPILGIVLDGLGFGDDGTFWGGEFLLGDYRGYERLASLKPVPLPGGNQAMREPWRNLYSHIQTGMGWGRFKEKFSSLALTRMLEEKPLRTLDSMMEKGINCPSASSCGRLFDAVAAALNIHPDRIYHDGQAAMELEALVDESALEDQADHLVYSAGWMRRLNSGLKVLDPAVMWTKLFQDLKDEVPVPIIAARFHGGLATALVSAVQDLSKTEEGRVFDTLVLSGGVFQNRILLEQVIRGLHAKGFKVLTHKQFPANDGGISLGQAMVSAARVIT